MAIALMVHSDEDGCRRSTVPRRRNSFGTDWRYVLLFVVLLLPFFEPVGLRHVISPVFGQIYLVAQIIAAVVVAALYLFRTPKDRFSLLAIVVVAFMLLTTAVNEHLDRLWIYTQWFYDWGFVVVAVLLTAYARNAERGKMRELLWAILIVTSVLSILNVLSVLVWPHIIDPQTRRSLNFYGHKNSSIYVALPSVGTSLMLDALAQKRCSVRSILLYVIGILQCALSYSATSMMTLVLLPVFFGLVQLRKIRPLFNGFTCLGGYVVTLLFAIAAPLRGLFSPLIEGALGKSLTFTGRTFIWDSVFALMTGWHVLIGYGASIRFGIPAMGDHFSDPHNYMLYLWISGGIVGLVLCGALILMAMRPLYQHRRDYPTAVLTVVVACFLVIGLMESLITISWPLMLALAYYWDTEDALPRTLSDRR